MDQVRQVLRYHHYAYRTENTYCDWIVRYIKYFGAKKHPRNMGKTEIDAYLSHLATERKVVASTQRQALNAIIFLYRHVLDQPVEEQIEHTRAKRHPRPPVVMTKNEVQRKGSSLLLTLDRYCIHVFIAFLFFTFISFHVLTLSSWWCNTAFI
jgi:hypothetical protein